MFISEIKPGMVIHNTREDFYARVKLLVAGMGHDATRIMVLVHGNVTWDPNECAPLTPREKAEVDFPILDYPSQDLDREV